MAFRGAPCRYQLGRRLVLPGRHSAPRRSRALAPEAPSTSTERNNGKPILLFDVMDTLVWDPFYTEMPHFFDMRFQDLLAQKDTQAWPRFERGEISEEEMLRDFFKDRRPVNGSGLLNAMLAGYRWLDGMEFLLLDLARQGVEMHVMSNYPVWWRRIEAKLAVSRFLPWTFISCEGPLKGLRKPDPEAYARVAATLGAAPEQLLLVDDRHTNVEAALDAGWGAIQFTNEGKLRHLLEKRRVIDRKRRVVPG